MSDQTSFYSFFQNSFGTTRTEKLLDKIDLLVPWQEMEADLLTKYERGYGGVGRPRKNIVVLLKCLFLQGLYNLSDPEVEDQLKDRHSFQKFVGIEKVEDIPDETTICKFRNDLVDMGYQESMFTITQRMLNESGITVKKGHIQDGTIIETAKGKKNKYGQLTRDPEATFVTKAGKTHHGYKGHAQTDVKGQFIMNTTYTTASVHDSQQQDAVMTGDEKDGYGDSAYMNKNKDILYEECGMNPNYHVRGTRGNPLTKLQKEMNRIKSCTRAKGEHPFAWIKNRYMYTKTIYRGLVKNAMHWFMICTIYNFERLARAYA